MQASRAFSRLIAAGSKASTRQLHITGPAPFSSLLTSNQPIALATPLPIPHASDTGKLARQFNTSRSLKSAGDSSTIDFMFIPDFDPDLNRGPVEIRVPILPWTESSPAAKAAAVETDEPVMIPVIHTVAADGTHIHAPSAMSDVSDSQHFNYHGMAAQVASKFAGEANKFAGEAEQSAGMAKQLWSGLMEDIMGPKGGSAKA